MVVGIYMERISSKCASREAPALRLIKADIEPQPDMPVWPVACIIAGVTILLALFGLFIA